MPRELTEREREVALALIRRATPSPEAADRAGFTAEQEVAWERPESLTAAQRTRWEEHLAEAVVTHECGCGTCPTVGMRPRDRADDPRRDDRGGPGDFRERIILEAAAENAQLLLFVDDGVPGCMELAPICEEGHLWTEFPPPEEITF
ncbi:MULTISPECIES: hypothetical protein [Brevibacterium]|uniref:Uncharacterized protein n=1 Tax=Brevibacterium salitolerans TaxID=1403566 RepID=A0ABN2WD22_9MICO|nr:hypothetical protein [Brevibacterium sp.]